MTELIIRTVAGRPAARLARPSAVIAFALAIAYGTGAWLQALHRAEGGAERGEPGLIMHWLRDSTLSLPLVFAAVWVAILVARRWIERADAPPRLAGLALAGVVAAATSVATAAGGPAHSYLFEATHGGHELSLFAHLGRDTLIALAVSLPIAAGVSALMLRRRPWAAPQVGAWLQAAAAERRAVVTGLACVLVVAPVAIFASSSAQLATAQGGPGSPCPASAPVKRFSVQAIDVDIPLNRFGDHDPQGKMFVLSSMVDEVRAQESSRRVSIGLRDDPIQPLVIRANLGDCVEISFTNNASGGEYGVHIDGLAFGTGSSGDAVGRNSSSAVGNGETRSYRYWVPRDPEVEGTHYIRPGPGNRQAVAHGLFGAISVQPAGSTYQHPDTGQPLESGWEAVIDPGSGPSYREYTKLYHEIGDERYEIPRGGGGTFPTIDPTTDAYRPGSRAINYRTEPFQNRLEQAPDQKALAYNSYTFGDPATPIMRGYVGDPTKIRILHAGSEVFHIYHLHGGGIRWRANPKADDTNNYADVGLNKHPVEQSGSTRIDSQAFGPGESYSLEIEGGAGGVQQTVGDLLEHCHIASHYVSGMWNFWRVMNTRNPELRPLADRAAPPSPVDSAALIGRTMPDGTTITSANLEAWVKPLLPPPGTPRDRMDASVWNWTRDGDTLLGEPEDNTNWPNMPNRGQPHPSALPGDEFVGNRPKIMFDPRTGRPAYPLLRTHVGRRAPHAPNGHSGAPYLGERGSSSRPDGICPQSTPATRRYNVTAIQLPIRVTDAGATDQNGQLFVLSKNKTAVRNGTMPREPLAIRANVGDCVALTLTSEQNDIGPAGEPLNTRANMHIHHVQFDVQGSDGASTGMVFDQSVRPYQAEDPQITAISADRREITVQSAAKFQPGVWIGVGLGTDNIEIRQITQITGNTLTLDSALEKDHQAGEWAGTEFVQSRWYPDVQLDNVFWHDHVDGIHGWGHGLVGQLVVEPPGSTYHDPRTGEQVDSGTIVDIRTNNPLAPGLVEGSFRELVLWQINDNPAGTDSTLNLRAEPWADRIGQNPDPSLLFSSWTHGDPNTPLPRAYAGDPFVIRTINVSGHGADTLKVDGHRFFLENRLRDSSGNLRASPIDTLQYGISERFTAILDGGAGGPSGRPGDYLYMNAVGRRFQHGAWGLLRVLPQRVGDLQPLPGRDPGGLFVPPSQNGGRPPTAEGPGSPCPGGAAQRNFQVTAVDVPGNVVGRTLAFVPSDQADAVRSGAREPEPLVLHAAEGECVNVQFTNGRQAGTGPRRASFHVSKLERTVNSSGVNVGFNPEQTVEPGQTRTYRYYADSSKIGSAPIADFGDTDTGTRGLYGAVVVAPRGATFTDPRSGSPRDIGAQVDVHVPGSPGYRDYTLLFANDDRVIGGNVMPYTTQVEGPSFVNYRSAPRPDDASAFSTAANGDPSTPILQAYAGDPVKVHAVGAPGNEQPQVFGMGGLPFPVDPNIPHSNEVSSANLGAWETIDTELIGGAGGRARTTGDFFYGDVRRPFTTAGSWGLLRVLSDPSCPIQPLDGLSCIGQGSTITDLPPQSNPAPAGGGQADTPPEQGGGGTPAAGLRGLFAPRRISIRTLARRGLPFRVTVPVETRALSFRLVRVGSTRTRGRSSAALIARGNMVIRRGGTLSRRWKLPSRAIRRLRSGRYRFELQAGTSRTNLNPARVTRTITLFGRPVRGRR